MSASLRRSNHRPRRHGVFLQPADRRALERSGWRTTLDYRENHIRGRDGCLLRVEAVWTAEAERYDGEIVVASAEGHSPDGAWAQLRAEIAADRVVTLRRVRFAT